MTAYITDWLQDAKIDGLHSDNTCIWAYINMYINYYWWFGMPTFDNTDAGMVYRYRTWLKPIPKVKSVKKYI